MPNHDDDRRRARIGAALIAVVTAVSVAVFFLDTLMRGFSEGPHVTMVSSAAPGVEPGTTVWVAGRPVGRVLSVGFRPPGEEGEAIVIVAVLQRGIGHILRADATAKIQAAALLEPVVIAIDPGAGSAPPWDFADTLRTPTDHFTEGDLRVMADTLLGSGAELAGQARALRDRIRRGGGTLAALESNPGVIEAAVGHVRRLQRLLRDDVPSGTVARLATDTLVGGRVTRIGERLARLDSLAERRAAQGGVERATRALDSLEARLARLSERLDAGEGSLGRGLVDGEMARQIALLRARLDSLVVELVRDPSRWLRVRVF